MVWFIYPSLVVHGLMRPYRALPSLPLVHSAVVTSAGVSFRPSGFSAPFLFAVAARGPPPRLPLLAGSPAPLRRPPRSRRLGGAPPPPSLWLAPFATLRASLRFGRAVAYGGLLSAMPASAFAFRPAWSLRSLLRSAARLRPFFFGWRGARFGWSSVSPRPDATLCAPYSRATSAGAPRCDHPCGK